MNEDPPIIAGMTPVVERLRAIESLLANTNLLLGATESARRQMQGDPQAQGQPQADRAGQTVMPPGHTPGGGAPQPQGMPAPPAAVGVGLGGTVAPAAPQGESQVAPQAGGPQGPGYGAGGGAGGGGGGTGGGGGGTGPTGGNPNTPQPGLPPNTGAAQNQNQQQNQAGTQGGNQGGGRGGGFAGAITNVAQAAVEGWRVLNNVQGQIAQYQYMQGTDKGRARRDWLGEQIFTAQSFFRDKDRSNFLEGEARQAYIDATAFGFNEVSTNGEYSRADVTEFMFDQGAKGMRQAQSSAILATAMQGTQVSLADLSDAITNVGQAAGQAGVSAQIAYQNFQNYLTPMIQQFGGRGAAGTAGRLAAGQASMGRAFQDTDFQAQFQGSNQYLLASYGGVSVGEIQYSLGNGGDLAFGVANQMTQQTLRQLMRPEWIQFIEQRVEAIGGRAALQRSPRLAATVGQAWFSRFRKEIDLNVLQKVIQNTSRITISPGEVPEYVVLTLYNITATSQENYERGSGGAVQNGRYTDTGEAVEGRDAEILATARQHGITPSTEATGDHKNIENDATRAYEDLVSRNGGAQEPVIEALLTRVKNPNKAMVSVTTHGGEQRVMSLTEAIKYFPNQVIAGEIQFLSGKGVDDQGKSMNIDSSISFEQVAGTMGDKNQDFTSEIEDASKATIGEGLKAFQERTGIKTEADLEKEAAALGVEAGKQMLDLTPDAAKLVRLLDGGSKTGKDAERGTTPDASENRMPSYRTPGTSVFNNSMGGGG